MWTEANGPYVPLPTVRPVKSGRFFEENAARSNMWSLLPTARGIVASTRAIALIRQRSRVPFKVIITLVNMQMVAFALKMTITRETVKNGNFITYNNLQH
jgi:hypothetical protein